MNTLTLIGIAATAAPIVMIIRTVIIRGKELLK